MGEGMSLQIFLRLDNGASLFSHLSCQGSTKGQKHQALA